MQVWRLLGLPSSLNCLFEPLYFKSLSLCLIGIINPRFELTVFETRFEKYLIYSS